MTFQSLIQGAMAISAAEWIAVVLALAYLVLAVKQHIGCWLFAALSSGVFLWLFAQAGLVMQAALQVFYIAMAVYGWYSWRGGHAEAAGGRPVVRWSAARHLWAILAILLVSAANGALSGVSPIAAVRYVDAVVAWGSVFATWLVARKVLENWLYWIVLDFTAAGLYFSQGLYATAMLFVLYSAIAVQGYRSWKAGMAPRPAGVTAA